MPRWPATIKLPNPEIVLNPLRATASTGRGEIDQRVLLQGRGLEAIGDASLPEQARRRA
jgi:hypothetical protein